MTDTVIIWFVFIDEDAKTILLSDDHIAKFVPDSVELFDDYDSALVRAEHLAKMLGFDINNETVPF